METGLQVTPFDEMERADEQMVLDEIKGRAIDTLVYEIQQDGRTVTGLSLSGVRETARVMNSKGQARIRISDKEPTIIETDDYFEIRIYAVDEMNGGGNWGIKRQEKMQTRRDGGQFPNTFAYEQALAKAQRNALRGLIPEWFIKQMIDTWRAVKSNVKTIETQPQRQQTQPRTTGHWYSNETERAAFGAKVKELGFDADSAKNILEVTAFSNFKGTRVQAEAKLQAAHDAMHAESIVNPNAPIFTEPTKQPA